MEEKDYYKLLGVSSSATQEEIKKAFFRLAKKYHPDRHRGDNTGSYEAKFAQINEAYNLLKDEASKDEYDKKYRDLGRKSKRSAHEKYQAEELYHTALKAIKIKDVNSAIDLLKAAIRLEPEKAEYYSTLGTALSEKPRRLHEAREICEKAVEMEPYDVDNYVNLGMVYRKAGLEIRARKQFEKALRWDPNHRLARAQLGVSNRSGWVARVKGFFKKMG